MALVKLYDRKHAITAADMINDRVLPFYEERGIPLLRILTDRGSEYCGNREHHLESTLRNLENDFERAHSIVAWPWIINAVTI